MRAHQVMCRRVITTSPQTSIADAARTMLNEHISGLPVVDSSGRLVGIVSEADFVRRSEIGTGRRRGRWITLLFGAGKMAAEFVQENGRVVADVMTTEPITVSEDASIEEIVSLMEKNNIKRIPVLRDKAVVGMVTRSNLLQAVASLARDIPDPTADDDHIRDRVRKAIEKEDWKPANLEVIVRDGIVHLSGMITDERSRRASIVAAENVSGVVLVHDHLSWVDSLSALYYLSPEDEEMSQNPQPNYGRF
ncbi:CBS domain-containing protein [Bradyrhizobium sp. SYSU BS000235]|uniref:CBS domain-containing protein n=1 Tax=Bradyrhizobium sp. SYSU BS000235 TaxID=3411332 RepID=UPI003C73F101